MVFGFKTADCEAGAGEPSAAVRQRLQNSDAFAAGFEIESKLYLRGRKRTANPKNLLGKWVADAVDVRFLDVFTHPVGAGVNWLGLVG